MIQQTAGNNSEESPERVELAIEEYLNKRGMLNTEEWLSRYPDCTLELLEFLGNQSRITAIAEPFAGPAAVRNCHIGEYEVLGVLDRGGMGIVYKARQKSLRRIVALKMIQQGQFRSPEVRKRFQNEAETAARLRHPNLVAIHEVGEHNGIPYFSMEYVKGRTLADLSRQGRIRPNVVAQLTQTIAETIHYIHSCGILHRDLKPSNVMLDDNCEVRITDFGLAKQLDRDYSLTETGQILGSIDYMPPEQAEARHEKMGPASDVYSIGAILYELLAGRPPFRSESFLESLRQIREDAPVSISKLSPRVPRRLEAICLKCLHKKPSRRYQTAEELSLALKRFLDDEPVRADYYTSVHNLIHMRRFQAIAGTTLATLLFGVIWCFMSPRAESVADGRSSGAPADQPPNSIASPILTPSQAESVLVGDPQSSPVVQASIADAKIASTDPESQPVRPKPEAATLVQESPKPTTVEQEEPAVAVVPKDDPGLPVITAIGIPGSPFGIAHLELEVSDDCDWTWQPDKPLRLTTESGKALYASSQWVSRVPAYRDRPVILPRLKIWYLFEGDKPPAVTVVSGDEVLVRNVAINTNNVGKTRSRLLSNWLDHFAEASMPHGSREMDAAKRYFNTMLARRMNVSVPAHSSSQSASGLEVEFERTFGMLFGFESIRLAMMADKLPSTLEGREAATQMLPTPLTIPSVRIPESKSRERRVYEPIANHIPQECFYLRCFRVANYSWVRNLVQGWGGDIDGVVATPAADYRVRDRIESQLGLNIATLVGAGVDNEISDCALIGLDPFFHDGAAVGVLFEEKEGGRLADILKQTRDQVGAAAMIKETNLSIGTRTVRVLLTHDKQLRSFYVVSGQYHLITNSQTLAERFLQTEVNGASLGSLQEYSHARSEVRAEGACAAWLYLSDPFFRNITSPQYRIELQRRRQAREDLVALKLARLASEAETGAILEIPELVHRGFLPDHFGFRPDNTKPTVSEGVVCDSERGVPGTFVPIADIEFTKCTAFEATCYEEFKQAYQREWRSMDPVLLMFQRTASPLRDREEVVLKIHITPYAQQEYAFLRQNLSQVLDAKRIARLPNEVLGVSAKLYSQGERAWAAAGLIDEDVPFELRDGQIFRTGQNKEQPFSKSNSYALITDPDEASGYLLGNFVSCLKSRKPLIEAKQNESPSFLAALLESIFPMRAIVDNAIRNYSSVNREARVLSANKPLANNVLRDYQLEQAPRPAHLYMHLQDISESKVYPYIRAWTFMSSRHASAADAATVNLIADSLQEDPQVILKQLESAVGAELKCPIGGDYQPKEAVNRPPYIVSSAWRSDWLHDETQVPENYEFPFLKWLHGLELECTLGGVTLESRLKLDIEANADGLFEPIREVAARTVK